MRIPEIKTAKPDEFKKLVDYEELLDSYEDLNDAVEDIQDECDDLKMVYKSHSWNIYCNNLGLVVVTDYDDQIRKIRLLDQNAQYKTDYEMVFVCDDYNLHFDLKSGEFTKYDTD